MKRLFLIFVSGVVCLFLLGVMMIGASSAADAPKPAPGEAVNFPANSPEPPPTKDLFEAGKRTFGNRCARCHGWNMVNLGSISFDLRKFPREDRARFMNSVHNGKNAMPAWKGILTEDEFEGLWAYVRSGGQM